MIGRAEDVGAWRWAVCKSRREHLVVQVLAGLAQNDEESLLIPQDPSFKAMVCF